MDNIMLIARYVIPILKLLTEDGIDIKEHLKTKTHLDFLKLGNVISKIDKFFSSEDLGSFVINAECLFVNFILEHNLPLSVADHARELFKIMFPKCPTTKKSC